MSKAYRHVSKATNTRTPPHEVSLEQRLAAQRDAKAAAADKATPKTSPSAKKETR